MTTKRIVTTNGKNYSYEPISLRIQPETLEIKHPRVHNPYAKIISVECVHPMTSKVKQVCYGESLDGTEKWMEWYSGPNYFGNPRRKEGNYSKKIDITSETLEEVGALYIKAVKFLQEKFNEVTWQLK